MLGPVAATLLGAVVCSAAFALGGGAVLGAGALLLAGLLGLELAALVGVGAALVPAPRRGHPPASSPSRRPPAPLRRPFRPVPGGVR